MLTDTVHNSIKTLSNVFLDMDKAENTKQKCRIYLEIIFYCKWKTNYVKKQLVPKFVWAVCSCRETVYLMLEESSKNKLKRDERC